MTTTTLPSTSASLRQAALWRQTALAHLLDSRPPLAEALIAMPASVERLCAERTLSELDRSILQTRRALAEAERQLAETRS